MAIAIGFRKTAKADPDTDSDPDSDTAHCPLPTNY
jgi:hypothetical protein